MMRIAFLGPEGTVSEEAARFFFKNDTVEWVPFRMISDVFSATDSGKTDFSVIPIENTIDGSVSLHMDWLVHEVDLEIRAEWTYPSIQNLIGISVEDSAPLPFSRIRRILSHPVAAAQCRNFIREHLNHAELDHVSSTAEGVRLVGLQNDPAVAAIGTRLAAEKYELQVLSPEIQDNDANVTRFILIGKKNWTPRQQGLTKTSLLVTLPKDYPGALHQVLSAFAWRKINLSRLESRPTKKKLGSYYFYIDVEASMDSVLLPAAIAEIEAIGCQVRSLGSYPTYTFEALIQSEV